MLEYQGGTFVGNYVDCVAIMSHHFSAHRHTILQIQSKTGGLLLGLLNDLILVGSMLPGGHGT